MVGWPAALQVAELARPSYAVSIQHETAQHIRGSQAVGEVLGMAARWDAIDDAPVDSCLLSPFVHLDKVPDQHVEAWAAAMADVLRTWRDAIEEREKERMLKWLLILHDVLLRLPPRGGRRGQNAVSHRFAAWVAGDYATLIRRWLQDRAAARHPRFASTSSGGPSVKRAMSLLSGGHITRAVRLMTSEGLGDLRDERAAAAA